MRSTCCEEIWQNQVWAYPLLTRIGNILLYSACGEQDANAPPTENMASILIITDVFTLWPTNLSYRYVCTYINWNDISTGIQYYNNKRLETPNVQLVECTMVHLQNEKVHSHKKLRADIKKTKCEDTLLKISPIVYLQDRGSMYVYVTTSTCHSVIGSVLPFLNDA